MAGIFEAGYREFRRLRQKPDILPERVLDGARRAMRAAQLRETDRLEESLATLATIGSTSPYIGLFGTVWGIMNSFRGLGNVQSATLAMVAPGIAEALIATAMGLFAAIPAVIAYNRYADQVARLELRYDTFAEEFSTILQHYAHSAKAEDRRRMSIRNRKLMGDINVVPYIDVMLVLLIIFMVTAPLLSQGVKVELPDAAAEPLDSDMQDSEPLILSVDAAGNLYLNVGDNEEDPREPAQIVRLAETVLSRKPDTPVLVKADESAAYGSVITGMVLLQRAGAAKVGFLTDPAQFDPLDDT